MASPCSPLFDRSHSAVAFPQIAGGGCRRTFVRTARPATRQGHIRSNADTPSKDMTVAVGVGLRESLKSVRKHTPFLHGLSSHTGTALSLSPQQGSTSYCPGNPPNDVACNCPSHTTVILPILMVFDDLRGVCSRQLLHNSEEQM